MLRARGAPRSGARGHAPWRISLCRGIRPAHERLVGCNSAGADTAALALQRKPIIAFAHRGPSGSAACLLAMFRAVF